MIAQTNSNVIMPSSSNLISKQPTTTFNSSDIRSNTDNGSNTNGNPCCNTNINKTRGQQTQPPTDRPNEHIAPTLVAAAVETTKQQFQHQQLVEINNSSSRLTAAPRPTATAPRPNRHSLSSKTDGSARKTDFLFEVLALRKRT